MDFNRIWPLLIVSFFSFSCSSVKGVKSNFGEAIMYGMVYNDENLPVSGAAVLIDGTMTTLTDTQGRFMLMSKQRKEFVLVLEKSGYETVKATFRFEPMDVMHIMMINAGQLVNRAEIAMDEGRYREAVVLCDRAIALDGERIDAPYLKALGMIRLREYSRARYILETLEGHIGERDYIRGSLEGLPP
jgi:hypothetical protein